MSRINRSSRPAPLTLIALIAVLSTLGVAHVGAQLGLTPITEGDLVITEIMHDPDAVADAVGEWFEVRSRVDGIVDLGGLVVRDDGGDSFTVPGPLLVAFGDRVVLGRSSDPAANGGVAVDHAYGNAMVLSNGADELVLEWDGVVIDRVAWDDGATFPDPRGASMTLDPSRDDAVRNDVGTNWCAATSVFGDGDRGTPGEVNDACDLEPEPTPELPTSWLTGIGTCAALGAVRLRRAQS